MSMIGTGNSGIIRVLLFVIVFLIGSGFASSVLAPVDGSRADSTEENWNFKSTRISPENPTAEDTITFYLETNDDSEISEVKIYICKDNICGSPIKLDKESTNNYKYKSPPEFTQDSKVSYRFEVYYANSTKEKIPASTTTAKVVSLQGSLYFEFFIGEHYNYVSSSITPSVPSETDLVEFKLVLESETNVEEVMIEIAQLEPIYTPEFPTQMTSSGGSTYTYKHTKTFEAGSKIGYRFHVKNKDQSNYETIPVSSSTANVVQVEGELYFSFSIPTAPVDNGDDDKDDDGGFLPGFGALIAILSLALIVLFHFRYRQRKD